MDLRKLKEKATEAFGKGKFGKAAELYEQYCAKEVKDLQARLRMGDAWAKTGSKEKAIAAYRTAAEVFAKDGFVPRAIAAGKLVLELDPSHQGVQQMLADLYARKGTGPAPDAGAVKRGGGLMAPPPAPVAPPSPSNNPAAIEMPSEEESDEGEVVEGEVVEDERIEGVEFGVTPPAAAEPSPAGGAFDLSEQLPRELSSTLETEAPEPPAPNAGAAPPPLARSGDLESTLQALSQSRRVEAAAAPPVSSFSELSLEGDSLLHAVELAAEAGLRERHEKVDLPLEIELGAEEMVPDPQRGEALQKIPLFSDLSPEAFIELFERCRLRRFGEGERVFAQGSAGDSFFAICTGSVRVVREEASGRRELAALPEGAFFGEMALLSGSPRSAAVYSASEETQLLEISAPVLADVSRRYPQVAQALKKFCRQRLLANVMNSSPLFAPFDGKDRKTLVERFRAREVKPGEVLIREGERADGLYVLLSGEVEVHKGDTVLAKLKEGDIFGEMSLLTKAPATASVVAAKRTSILRLPRPDCDELILSHPQVLVLVSQLTDERRAQLDRLTQAPSEGELLV